MIPLATWLERRMAGADAARDSFPHEAFAAAPLDPRDDPADLAARIREEVNAELRDQFDREKEAEHSALLAEFEQRRMSEITAQGETLGRLLITAIESMRFELSKAISEVLSPLLSRSRISAAHEEFIARIVDVLGQAPATTLTVRGPEPLLQALREACGGMAGSIVCVPSDSIDAQASFDETVIETRIDDWLKQSGLG